MKSRFGVVLFIILLGAVTAWAEGSPSGNPPYTGFLKNSYTKLRASQEYEGLWVYVDKSKDFKGYSKLIFDPVKVFNPPYLTGTSLPPEELFKMRNDMFATLTGAFKSGYEVVDKPGPDVLKVSVSVTGVQMVKPDWKLGDNIPVKKAIDLFTGGKVVPLMSAEMEVLDAKGNIVAAASAMRKGEKELFKDDKLNWDHLQPVVSYWANGLRLGLDQLRVNADRVNPAE